MGMEDFWDNVRTPGFIDTMFEELADICQDAKKEVISLMEEGEEVFIDGFQQIVLEKNPDYKNSIQKRAKAKKLIDKSRLQLLTARGFCDEDSKYIYILSTISRTLKNSATKVITLDSKKLNLLIASFPEKYRYLSVLNPADMLAFAQQVKRLVKLPEAPQYIKPYSDKEACFINARLRKQRVTAADTFLSKARKYRKKMVAKVILQKEAGILFEQSKITDETGKILEEYERRLSLLTFQLKLIAKQKELTQEDWAQVQQTVLLIAGIYSILNLALKSTNSTDSTDIADALTSELLLVLDELSNQKN